MEGGRDSDRRSSFVTVLSYTFLLAVFKYSSCPDCLWARNSMDFVLWGINMLT